MQSTSSLSVPPELADKARYNLADYQRLYALSVHDPETFWGEEAHRLLDWMHPWQRVMQASFETPEIPVRWFEGGTLNVSVNCLDRHLKERAEQTALLWIPDAPDQPAHAITYRRLHQRVCRAANMLLKLGVTAGDTVTIYLPMIPEAVIAMLACARIGAIHSVVFGGFSPEALRGRLRDAGSRVIITADAGVRGGKQIALKANVDEALEGTSVTCVIVVQHTEHEINWQAERDQWWHALEADCSDQCEAPAFSSEHPLFILYTSGSTGSPKGLLHTSAGYLLYAAATFQAVFDTRAGDVYWCTADIGWITGHSYLVYGPLASGTTTVMFEGVPTYPTAARCWEIIDQHQVTQFYTAPTALRMLMREGDAWLKHSSRRSLRVLGSVGEPINPEVWRWYDQQVGGGHCRVVDTWWQTETGGHMITPLPGATPLKPGSATQPFFGVVPALLDPASGSVFGGEAQGALCIAQSWPAQARTIWGDHARYVDTYFRPYPGYYFSGDAAARDAEGDYWLLGRMDDVINVSGHRIGTAEVESALVAHPAVSEAAVVGFAHDIKGEDIHAYVVLMPHKEGMSEAALSALQQELRLWVRHEIGALAMPARIQITASLPKTRSGKIMRRILRKIAGGEIRDVQSIVALGDISTLLNPESVEALMAEYQRLFG
ncbi:MAG: acetate--CoA ligase [Rickettsiales bacterium]|nr:acetate--CoA ligase [Rickettsiales bacterium]